MNKNIDIIMNMSAGLFMYKIVDNIPYYFLAKHGGPLWENEKHSWSIPKGHSHKDEEILETAIREFYEETRIQPVGPYSMLTPVKNSRKNKTIHIFSFEKDWNPENEPFESNTMLWENKGNIIEIPEMAEGRYFSYKEATGIIIAYQLPVLQELHSILTKDCKHLNYVKNEKYIEGDYYNKAQYITQFICSDCGEQIKEVITYGGYN